MSSEGKMGASTSTVVAEDGLLILLVGEDDVGGGLYSHVGGTAGGVAGASGSCGHAGGGTYAWP